jgi:WD repeat-containing protein 7
VTTMIMSGNSPNHWCISGEVSASRALALIACLRALTHFGGRSYASHRLSMLNPPSDTADHTNTVVAFYATSLSHTVGRGYVPPNLSSLARWWFDVSSMT